MPLATVLFEMLIAKGVVSTLGHFGVIPLSSFAVNIVVALTLGAGTDYGIFLMGRYQEARQLGESREEAYYTAYRSVSPIIIGSGLTIAGAGFCLSFARLDYFHTMGPAVAIGMLFTIAAALTLGPAILTVGSLFGLFDPKRLVRGHLYRRIARQRGAVAGAHPRGQLRRRHARGDLRADLPGELRRPRLPAGRRSRPIRASRPRIGTSRRASCSPRC